MKLQIRYGPLIRGIREAETFRTPRNLILLILLFLYQFFAIEIVESLALLIGLMPGMFTWALDIAAEHRAVESWEVTAHLSEMLEDPDNVFILLLCTGFGNRHI